MTLWLNPKKSRKSIGLVSVGAKAQSITGFAWTGSASAVAMDMTMSPEELFKGLVRFERDESLKKKIMFMMVEWQRMFPDLNLREQIQYAHYWLLVHGVHRKRHDLYLSNWMRKAEEIRRTKPVFGNPIKKYVEQKPTEEVMEASDFERMREAIRDPKRFVA
jgi:hypothetical protein